MKTIFKLLLVLALGVTANAYAERNPVDGEPKKAAMKMSEVLDKEQTSKLRIGSLNSGEGKISLEQWAQFTGQTVDAVKAQMDDYGDSCCNPEWWSDGEGYYRLCNPNPQCYHLYCMTVQRKPCYYCLEEPPNPCPN